MTTFFNKIIIFFVIFVLVFPPSLLALPEKAQASFNEQINYQGKLTSTSNVAVADGVYHMRFALYTSETGGVAIWNEDRSSALGNRITVTNGLFSVMLGSSTSLANVDFNQTLYLGVEIGGSAGVPTWDGEMSPRKIFGAVPAAFVSKNLDGGSATTTNLLVTSSTTLQNFTAQNSTTTNATTTNLFSTNLYSTNLNLTNGILENSTTTNATSTYLYISGLASTTDIHSNIANIGNLTAGFLTGTNILANGSSTFQALFSISATATNLYSTNFLALGSSTLQSFTGTNYLAIGSTTLQNFTFQNATGTNATTTSFAISGLSNTLLKANANGSIIGATAGTDYQSPVSATFPVLFNSNVISLGFGTTTNNSWSGEQTFLASTTLQNFTFQNATGTSATTTNLYTSGQTILAGVSGNVGIGITNPQTKLNVLGAIVATSLLGSGYPVAAMQSLGDSGGGYDRAAFSGGAYWDEASSLWRLNNSGYGANAIVFRNGGDTNFIYTSGSSTYTEAQFTAASKMTLTNDGKLYLFGPTLTENQTDWNLFVSGNTAGATNPSVGIKLSHSNSLNSNSWVGISSVSTSAWSNTVDLAFITGVGAQAERMRITNGGNVGIGTTSPLTKLSVAGNTYIGGWLVATGTAQIDGATVLNSTLFVNSSTTLQNFTFQNATGTNATTTNLFVSGLASTTNIRSNTALFGNVGVGNGIPSRTLDVTGTGRFTSTLTLGSVTLCTGAQALQTDGSGQISCGTINTGGASTGGGWTTDNIGVITISTSTDRVVVGASTTPYGKFTVVSGNVSTTTAVFVPANAQTANIFDIYDNSGDLDTVLTASGYLGLGTTSPSQRLSVGGNVLADRFFATSLTEDSLLPRMIFTSATGTEATTTNFFSSNGTFTNFFGATGILTNLLVNSSTTLQNFTFQNATGTQATTTNLFSTNGTFTNLFANALNLANLLVTGSTTLQNFTFQNATGTNATTTNLFVSGLASTTNIRSNTALFGNVGIGTTSPITSFDVRSPSNNSIPSLSSTLGGQTAATFGNSGTNGILAIGHDNAGHVWFQGRSLLNDGSSEPILLNPLGGNIGIGTTSPLTKLSVAGNAYIGGWLVATGTAQIDGATVLNSTLFVNSSTTLQNFTFQNATGTNATTTSFAISGLSNTLLKANANGSIIGATAGTDYQSPVSATFPVLFNSNVISLGFGTTTNNSWSGEQTFLASTTLQNFTFQNATGTSATTTNLYTSGQTILAGVSGNVGIGTANPGAKFEVSDGTYGVQLIPYPAGTGSIIQERANNNLQIKGYSLNLFTNGTSRVFISSTGNVGVGSSSPTYKLSVEGTSSLGNQAIVGFLTATSTTASSTFSAPVEVTKLSTTDSFATSTFANGINILKGCITVVSGSCLGAPGTVSPRWNDIVDPAGTLTLNMSTYTTLFNWTTGTGANDLFRFQTDAASNGTGSMVLMQTGAGSTVKPLSIYAGSAQALMVDASARIGIGTSTPAGKVDIYSSVNGPGAGSEPTVKGTLRILDAGGDTSSAGGLEFKSAITGSGYGWRLTAPDEAGAPSALYFQKRANSASWTNAVTFRGDSGNVSIGSTSPYARLSVWGSDTSATTRAFEVANNASTTMFSVFNNGLAAATNFLVNGSSTLQAFTGTNYLALGSTTLQNFTFQNATGTQATTTNLFSTNGTFTNLFANTLNLANLLVTGSTTLQNFTAQNSTTTNATTTNFFVSGLASTTDIHSNIANIGNLTTGFLTGTNILANGSSTFQALFSTSATATNLYSTNFLALGSSTLQSFTGTNYLAIGSTTLQNFTFQNATGTNATTTNFYVSGLASTTNLRANTGLFGNVGIGLSSPTTKLHISDIAANVPQILVENTSTFGIRLGLSSSNIGFMGSTNATPIQIQTNGVARMHFDTTGNIGVGTSTPIANIDIFKSGDASIGLTASSTAGVQIAWTIGTDISDSGKFKISSSTILGTNDRFVIDGNGNVGIGTASPGKRLDVQAAQSEINIESTTGTNRASILFANTGAGVGLVGVENSVGGDLLGGSTAYAAVFGTSGALPVQFGTNNAVNMTILSGGNVGIGTTSPAYKLQVDSSASQAIVLTNNSVDHGITAQANTNVGAVYGFSPTNGGAFIQGISDGDTYGIRMDAMVGAADPTDTTPAFHFSASKKSGTNVTTLGNLETVFQLKNLSTDLLTVLGSGNIGVGTSTPIANIDIFKSGDASIGLTASSTAGVQMAWTIGTDISDSGKFKISSSTILGTNDRFVIDGNGNVGISTTSPSYKLSVSGSAFFDGGTIYTSSLVATSSITTPSLNLTNLLVNGSSTLQNFTFQNATGTNATTTNFYVSGLASTTNLRANTGLFGNVGIGMTTALTTGAAIQVAGGAMVSNVTVNNQIALNSSGANWGLILNNAANTWSLGYGASISSIGTSVLTWNSSGRVGIGTSTPGQTFHMVGGNALFNAGTANMDGDSGLRITAPIAKTHYNWMIGAQQNISSAVEITPSTAVGGGTFSTPTAVFTQAGTVGLGSGVTAPASTVEIKPVSGNSTLRVHSTSGNDAIAYLEAESAGGADAQLCFGDNSTLCRGRIYYGINNSASTNDYMNFDTNSIQRMTIDSVGRVGIGTSTPSHTLTISSSTAPQLALTDGSLTSNAWTFRSLGNFLYIATSSPTSLATSTVYALGITPSGVVNIPYQATTSDLHANIADIGNLRAGLLTLTNLLVTGSSTLQAFTGTNYTALSSTTLQAFTGTNYLALGSTTLQNFTASNSTTTNSTSTTFAISDITRGSVLFAGTGGAITQNNSNFFWDNTNSRLGLGTTTPEGRLDILSTNTPGIGAEPTVKGILRILDAGGDTGTAGGLEFKSAATGNGYGWRLTAPDEAGAPGALYFQKRANSASWTNAVTFRGDSGYVGIGTTSPVNKLDIFSTNADASQSFISSSTAGAYMAWVMGTDISDSGKFKISSSTALGTNDRFVIDGNGVVSMTNLLATGSTTLQAFTASQGTITSATSTNSYITNLLVNGSTTLQAFTGTNYTALSSTTLQAFTASQGTITSATSTNLYTTNFLALGSTTLQNFTFQNATGTSATTTNLYTSGQTILAGINGNVGIGTTAPSALLHLYGADKELRIESSAGTPQFSMYSGTGNAGFRNWALKGNNAAAGNLDLYRSTTAGGVATTHVMSWDTNGNVGIGTTAPGGLLNLSNTGTAQLWISDSNAAVGSKNRYIQSADGGMYFGKADDAFGNLSDQVAILSNGNVGIGTTNPGRKLEVYGDGQTVGLNYPTASSYGQVGFYEAGVLKGYVQNIGSTWAEAGRQGDLELEATGDITLQATNGNVGIGTTTPATLLNVYGDASFGQATKSTIFIRGSAGTAISFNRNPTSGAITNTGAYSYQLNHTESTTNTSDYLAWQIYDTAGNSVANNAFVLNGVGNVGIGSTSPLTKLSVAGNAYIGGWLMATGTASIAGNTYLGSELLVMGSTTLQNFTGTSGTTTNFFATNLTATNLTFTNEITTNSTSTNATTTNLYVSGLASTTNLRANTGLFGNVGIGTTSPNASLEIYNGSGISSPRVSAVGGDAVWRFYNGTSYKGGVGWDSGTDVLSLFSAGDSATPALAVNSSGNVGIGTTTPGVKLDVAGSTRISGYLYVGTTTQQGVITIEGRGDVNGNGSAIIFNQAGVRQNYFGLSSGLHGSTVTDMVLSIENGNDFIVEGSGNVGIGTTSPTAKLSIAGVGATTGLNLQTTDSSNRNVFSINDQAEITIGTNAISNAVLTTPESFRINIDSDSTASSNTFSVGANGTGVSGGNTYFAVLDGGNVGVGTTSPSGKLHIVTTSSDGNVATWGTGQLVVGQDYSSGSLSGGLGLSYSTTNNAGYISSLSPGASWRDIGIRSNNTIFYQNGASEAMRITSSGNVGIGTNAPTSNFQVAQATAGVGTVSTTATLTTVTGVGTQFLNTFKVGDTITVNAETRTISAIASDTSLTTDAWTGTNSGAAYTLVGGNRFAVKGNGNVGIGTTAPTTPFHVYGTSASAGFIIARVQNTTADGASYFNMVGDSGLSTGMFRGGSTYASYGGANSLNIYQGNNAPIAFITNNSATPQMVLTGTGNVGIGTTNPTRKLQIDAAAAGVYIKSTTGTNNVNFAVNNTGGDFWFAREGSVAGATFTGSSAYESLIYSEGAYDLGLATNGTIKMTVQSGGNVGIGTTNPDQLLRLVKAQNATTYLHMSNSTAGTAAASAILLSADAGDIVMKAFSSSFTTSGQNVADAGLLETSATLSGGLNISTAGTQQIGFWQNGSEKMRIHTDGNVGIGTNAPTAKLTVSNGASLPTVDSTTGLLVQSASNVDEAASSGGTIVARNTQNMDKAVTQMWFTSGALANNQLSLFGTGDNAGFQSRSQSTGATRAIVFNPSGGNVGIGTTSPTSLLSLGGSATNPEISAGTSDGADNSSLNLSGGGLVGDTRGAFIQLIGNERATNPGDLILGTGNVTGGDMRFYTGGVGDRMVITKDGNVGIGTTNPDEKLNVAGAIRVTSNATNFATQNSGLIDYYNNNLRIVGVGSVGQTVGMQFITYNAGTAGTNMVLTGAGNVGIGTSSPTRSLMIDSSSGPIISLVRSTLNMNRFEIETDGTNMSIGPRDSGSLILKGGAFAEMARITSTGLQVTGSTTLQSATGTNIYISNQASTTNLNANIANIGNLTVTTCNGCSGGTIAWPFTKLSTGEQATSTTLAFLNGFISTASSTINSNLAITGTLGVGTSSPSGFKVDIGGNAILSGDTRSLQIGQTGGQALYFQNTSNGISFNGNQFAFMTTQTLGFNFTGGNVGIGTTTPSRALTISASAAPQLALTDASLTSNAWTMRSLGNFFYLATSSPTSLATSTVPSLTITPSNMVGIGTSTPAAATLSVQGSIYSSGNIMTSGQLLGSLPFNFLTTPTAAPSINMSTYSTLLNWTTGSGVSDLFRLQTDASANGTGSLLLVQTGAGATVKPLNVYAGSAQALTVDTSGRTGFGTTSPGARIDVNQISGQPGAFFGDIAGTGTGGTMRFISAQGPLSTADYYIQLFDNSRSSTGGVFRFTGRNGANDTLDIDVTNSRVGIGSTTPGTALAVVGTTTGYGFVPSANLAYGLGNSAQRFKDVWVGTANIGTSTWSISNGSDGRLTFNNAANSAGTETVSLATNGNVGIGVTNPQFTLEVAGNQKFYGVPTASSSFSVSALSSSLAEGTAVSGGNGLLLKLDSERFVVVASNAASVYLGKYNSTDVSIFPAVTFDSSFYPNGQPHISIAALDSNRFVIGYAYSSWGSKAVVCTASNENITCGTPTTITTNGNPPHVSVDVIDSTYFIMGVTDVITATGPIAKVVQTSGNTIVAVGSAGTIADAVTTNYASIKMLAGTTTRFAYQYYTGGIEKMAIGNISGTSTISFGAPANMSVSAARMPILALSSSTVVTFSGTGANVILANITSTSTIATSSVGVLTTTSNNSVYASFLNGSDVVVSYSGVTNAFRILSFSSTTLTSIGAEQFAIGTSITNVAGLSSNSFLKSSGQYVSLITGRNTNTTYSTLAMNSTYAGSLFAYNVEPVGISLGDGNLVYLAANSTLYMKAVLRTGNGMAVGTQVNVATATISWVSAAPLDSTKFVTTYSKSSGGGLYQVDAMVCSAVALTITCGNPVAIATGFTSNIYSSVDALDSSNFVVAYASSSVATSAFAKVGTVSGTSISSLGSAQSIAFSSANPSGIKVTTINGATTKFAFAISGSNFAKTVVGNTSGTTITLGTAGDFATGTPSYMNIISMGADSYQVIFSNASYGIISSKVSITGSNTISTTTQIIGGAGSSGNGNLKVDILDSTHYVVLYGIANPAYGRYRVVQTSGDTISLVASEQKLDQTSITNIQQFRGAVGLDSTSFAVEYYTFDGVSSYQSYSAVMTLDDSDLYYQKKALVINSTGLSVSGNPRVGVGISSPSYTLHVLAPSTDTIVAMFGIENGAYCSIQPANTALVCSSDARMKENINTIASSTDIIRKLRGVNFNWIGDSAKANHTGFIAQEVQAIAPELVSVGPDGMLGVNYLNFAPYLVNAWNALDVRVSSLEGIATSTLPATSTPMLAVTSTGLGIGTLTPAFALHAKFGGEGTAVFENENGICEINPNSGSFGCAPNREVIVATSTIGTSLASSTEIIKKLRGVNLSLMSASSSVSQFGFLAGDVEMIAPELVSNVGGIKLVKTTEMIPLLVNSVADLAVKIDTIDERLAKLEALVATTTTATSTTATSTGITLGGLDLQFVVDAVIGAFQNMTTQISFNIAKFSTVFADNIIIGSKEKPSGITLYDIATREPFCMRIQNGGQITTQGACSDVLFVSTTPTDGGTTSGDTSGAVVITDIATTTQTASSDTSTSTTTASTGSATTTASTDTTTTTTTATTDTSTTTASTDTTTTASTNTTTTTATTDTSTTTASETPIEPTASTDTTQPTASSEPTPPTG